MYSMAYKKSRKTVVMNLRPILKAQGMTLVDLARKTGLNRAALHDQAAGRSSRVDYVTLAQVKKVLGVTWDELLKEK
jgi:transcriptional regulator with XRE-family HTH domain